MGGRQASATVGTGGGAVVGSWLGRALSALPAALGAVGAGLVVAGWIGTPAPGVAVWALLTGAVLLRMSVTGLVIDLEREVVVVRTFWRTHRLAPDELRRVDAGGPAPGPGLRFVTRDGREIGLLAVAYLDPPRAERLVGQLRDLAAAGPCEVTVDPAGLRRRSG